jgi:DNA-binding CsgD family transcriptional regulator
LGSASGDKWEVSRTLGDPPGRLKALEEAFRLDPRPGLIFEFGRLVLANDAAKRLLRSSVTGDGFLRALKAGLAEGRVDRDLCLQTSGSTYQMELQHTRGRTGHWATVCFLVEQPAITPALRNLSDRELAVLRWLVRGLTNGEIAERLGISIETVRKHVASALKKTRTKTRTGLVGLALRASK